MVLDVSNPSRASSTTVGACRSCGSQALTVFLDLGITPLADRLRAPERLDEPEPAFPLRVAFCDDCTLVQLTETVDPAILFADAYPYYSSFSPALLEHSRANVRELVQSRGLSQDSFVIELASNDGYLLRNYVELQIPVLGIDPADGPARAAVEAGVPTLIDFFSEELACKLAARGQQADIVHANNVLAHVADTNGFIAGIGSILKDDGVAVIEVPYLKHLIENVEFDTIYHEHLCYFSVTALDRLFRRHDLYLNRVQPLTIHGGSLRLFIERRDNPDASVNAHLAAERSAGMDSFSYYETFSTRVRALTEELRRLLADLAAKGRSIAAYGAAAKGATLLNVAGIGAERIAFVVDRNVHKHGKMMPGSTIPIRSPEALLTERPDVTLLLAWNFADEILAQQAAYREAGGRFAVPIPSPRLV